MILAALPVVLGLLAQSSAPDTSGSDSIVLVVGVLIVTGIIVFVVARRSRS